MSWTRCTNCATIYDRGRFARCCICGAQPAGLLSPPGEDGATAAPADSAAKPASAVPEVEREAARDSSLSAGANAMGIVLGLGGLGLGVIGSNLVGGGSILLVLLALGVVTIAGWSANKKDQPELFLVGRIASRALVTIAVVIAGAALLGAIAIAVLFVICVTGSGGGFGS